MCLDNRSFDHTQIPQEPFGSLQGGNHPGHLQLFKLIGLSEAPPWILRCLSVCPEDGVSPPQLHTQGIQKLPLHGGGSSLMGSPAFTVIKNDSIDRFVWCLLIYLRFIPGNSWLYPSRTVTLTSPPAARQTGFGYSCS